MFKQTASLEYTGVMIIKLLAMAMTTIASRRYYYSEMKNVDWNNCEKFQIELPPDTPDTIAKLNCPDTVAKFETKKCYIEISSELGIPVQQTSESPSSAKANFKNQVETLSEMSFDANLDETSTSTVMKQDNKLENCAIFLDWDQTLVKPPSRVPTKEDAFVLSMAFKTWKTEMGCDIYIITGGTAFDIAYSTVDEDLQIKPRIQLELKTKLNLSHKEMKLIFRKASKITAPIKNIFSTRNPQQQNGHDSKLAIIGHVVNKDYEGSWENIFFVDDQMDIHLSLYKQSLGELLTTFTRFENLWIKNNCLAVDPKWYPHGDKKDNIVYYRHLSLLDQKLQMKLKSDSIYC